MDSWFSLNPVELLSKLYNWTRRGHNQPKLECDGYINDPKNDEGWKQLQLKITCKNAPVRGVGAKLRVIFVNDKYIPLFDGQNIRQNETVENTIGWIFPEKRKANIGATHPFTELKLGGTYRFGIRFVGENLPSGQIDKERLFEFIFIGLEDMQFRALP